MRTIGDLLDRDLSRRIEEIIQVDQADEQSVHDEITEYIATDSIREQYHELFRAIADAPSDPHEGIGVWISGFFGSGKSSFAKYLGYALQNKAFLGENFADLFKQQIGDNRISDLLDLINTSTPTEVILFEVAKERDTRKVTERIFETRENGGFMLEALIANELQARIRFLSRLHAGQPQARPVSAAKEVVKARCGEADAWRGVR